MKFDEMKKLSEEYGINLPKSLDSTPGGEDTIDGY
jgi:hypothetical protein